MAAKPVGGFLPGWGVLIGCFSARVCDTAPEPVRRAAMTSLRAWSVLDSSGSVATDHASNALFNLVVRIAAAGQLWRPA